MIWLNPWAWLGAAALAVPILVHLLARRRARPLLFPTLRFLGASSPLLSRRDRLSDLLVLLVRLGIVLACVAALAQPHFMTAGREEQLNRLLARAVMVDISASMRRNTSSGERALDAARREAGRLAGEASLPRVQESSLPARDLAADVAWLARQPGRRELAVISDFQIGTLTEDDIAKIPAGIGLRFVRIGVAADPSRLDVISNAGGRETRARVTLSSSATNVEWISETRSVGDLTSPVLLVGDAERSGAEAARDAARAVSANPAASRPVAIVFPGFPERASLIKDAKPLAEPWMFETLRALRANELLTTALASVSADDRLPETSPFSVVANGADGFPAVVAASDRSDKSGRFLLFASVDPGSVSSAALVAGVLASFSPGDPVNELDPGTIDDQTLKRWERGPGAAAPPLPGDTTTSDGRWFWVIALVLLGIEAVLRRTRNNIAAAATEVTHARVA